jgi:PTH2 family peptidyl-tRNA hydrolase
MIKQVIVVRTDLRNIQGQKIRTGKIAVQVAHASMKVFLDMDRMWKETSIHKNNVIADLTIVGFTEAMIAWMDGIFTKICVSVNSEAELLDIYNKAKEAGLPCSLIQDCGKTEFKEPTYTCCALGPDRNEKIDIITGNLSLL